MSENSSLWDLVKQLLKDFYNEFIVGGKDPLVLDLDGDGIELSAMTTGIGGRFDVDGDQYAEFSGWVDGDDGMLAIDLDASGTIDDVSELFGGPGVSGFDELAAYDSNSDGVIDANDTQFSDLRVWQDIDGDRITDAGELKTLSELSIKSIGLTNQADGTEIAGNVLANTGTFTYTDDTTGTVGDVLLETNNFDTEFTGDTTVDPAIAAANPNLKGHGTLTDLHVALTLEANDGDPLVTPFADTIATVLPTLDDVDIELLRDAAFPILEAWMESAPGPAGLGGHADVPVFVERTDTDFTVHDFAVEVTEQVDDGQGGTMSVTYWKLASGNDVLDANDDVIDYPTLAEVLAQTDSDPDFTLETLDGAHIDFFERFFGEEVPVTHAQSLNTGAIGALSSAFETTINMIDLMAVRLAMQGPLAPYFDGIEYQVDEDKFVGTTTDQLVPMFEAIFDAAPATAGGALAWLESWEPIVDVILNDYDRGGSHLKMTHAFIFTTVVAAAENTGLALDVKSAAVALGVTESLIKVVGPDQGSSDHDILYISAGNDTILGGEGADVYVFGEGFGVDVIDDIEDQTAVHEYDVIRFAHLDPGDVTLTRVGKDLLITVDGTSDQVTVLQQFQDLNPDANGNHIGTEHGINEIVFADGTVWTESEIGYHTVIPEATSGDDLIVGTDHIDFLDGGAGNDTLKGGTDFDYYTFGLGYGDDVIEELAGNINLNTYDFLEFGSGIAQEDLIFVRNGDSDTVTIEIDGTTDSVTLVDEFAATYTGPYGKQFLSAVDNIEFEDGTRLYFEDMAQLILDSLATDGDDLLYGFSFEDILTGGLGDDTLHGGNEDDVYVYDLGDGNDVIEDNLDNILSGYTDVLRFGPNVVFEEVAFGRIGASDDLLLTMDDGAVVTIAGQFDMTYTGAFGDWAFDAIEYFQFTNPDATTTTYTSADIEQLLLDQYSTDQADEIYGFAGAQTLAGGLGDDTLSGREGNDTYLFDLGDGADTIHDRRLNTLGGSDDVLKFGAGILQSDIVVSRNGTDYDLVLSISGTTDQVTLQNQTWYYTAGTNPDLIETVEFDDASTLSAADLRAMYLTQAATSGADEIIGFETGDTLDGGAGADTLRGGDGSDTYIFESGSGNDLIVESVLYVSYDDDDSVVFTGLASTDVSFSRSGDDAVITIDATGETLTLQDQLYSGGTGKWLDVESFVFTDTTIDDLQLADLVLQAESTSGADTIVGTRFDDNINGGAGNDSITGLGGDDTLDGGADDDTLSGGEDSDTYMFGIGSSQDTISDGGYSGTDRVRITGYTTADVTYSRAAPGTDDLLLTFSGGSDQLTVVGLLGTSSFYDIAEFEFDDGTIWTQSELTSWVTGTEDPTYFPGTSGDDSLVGTNADETFEGLGGNDTLNGGKGNDTHIWRAGDGNDLIDEYGSGTYTDAIELDGLNIADVTFTRSIANTYDMTIAIDATGEVLTVDDQFYGAYWGMEEIHFEDGTIWDFDDIVAAAWYRGTAAAESITGTNASETFVGGAGDDTVNTGKGDDTIVWGAGDGNDLIDEYGAGSYTDIIVLDGLDIGDVTFARSIAVTYDMTITIDATGEVLTVDDQFYGAYWAMEEIHFDDGTIWDANDIVSAAWYRGTAAAESITGSNASETFVGGAGDDTVNTGKGDDTIVWGAGDGNDLINEYGSGTYTDAIELDGLNIGDVTFARSIAITDDMTITIDATGEVLTVDDQFVSTAYGMEQVEFDDGTVWGSAQIEAAAWYRGTASAETITGTSDDETFLGGGGDDTLDGNAGDDVFVFETGAGHDTIVDFVAGAATDDVIQLSSALGLADFAAVQAASQQVGSDTVITIDANTSITLSGVTAANLHADDFSIV